MTIHRVANGLLGEAAVAILERKDALSEAVMERHYAAHPELLAAYGDRQKAQALEDAASTLTYLAEALRSRRPRLFQEYLLWLREVLAAYGVSESDLRNNLDIMRDVLIEDLDEQTGTVLSEYWTAAFDALAAPATPSASYINEAAPLGPLSRAYLDRLLRMDRHGAVALILDAVEKGNSVKELYRGVFEPVLYEVGRLWQTREITVGEEHYITAVTQLAMSQLYRYVFSNSQGGPVLVAACVGSELHEIGMRMVADYFELSGWDTHYLGANVPTASVLDALETRGAGCLAISATLTIHLDKVRDVIEAVRESSLADTKVLVGGYTFNLVPGLWKEFGADGWAPDAEQAVPLANRLVGS